MKLLIASDLHGSAYWTRRLIQALPEEAPDRILLLGDLLYHGPRNELPDEYAPKQVIELLAPLAKQLLCVRGNCDCEVDQMVLPFPMLAEYAVLTLCSNDRERLLYAIHGHNAEQITPLLTGSGAILLQGHTHVPMCEEQDGYLHLNPGSVSIPKQSSAHSYITFENGVFLWKDLATDKAYQEYTI